MTEARLRVTVPEVQAVILDATWAELHKIVSSGAWFRMHWAGGGKLRLCINSYTPCNPYLNKIHCSFCWERPGVIVTAVVLCGLRTVLMWWDVSHSAIRRAVFHFVVGLLTYFPIKISLRNRHAAYVSVNYPLLTSKCFNLSLWNLVCTPCHPRPY